MKIENCKKLVCNLYDTKNYVMQMTGNESWIETKANKQSDFFQSGSLAEATHWLEHKIETKSINNFKKDLFKQMSNSNLEVCGKCKET